MQLAINQCKLGIHNAKWRNILIELDKRFHDEIIGHALEDDTIECCGVLAGSEGSFKKLYRMTNVEDSAYRFSWDSKELISVWNDMEDNNWGHRAVYHSHTHSEAYPSSTDIRLAAWPEAFYIIVSLLDKQNPEVRAFRISGVKVDEVSIKII